MLRHTRVPSPGTARPAPGRASHTGPAVRLSARRAGHGRRRSSGTPIAVGTGVRELSEHVVDVAADEVDAEHLDRTVELRRVIDLVDIPGPVAILDDVYSQYARPGRRRRAALQLDQFIVERAGSGLTTAGGVGAPVRRNLVDGPGHLVAHHVRLDVPAWLIDVFLNVGDLMGWAAQGVTVFQYRLGHVGVRDPGGQMAP